MRRDERMTRSQRWTLRRLGTSDQGQPQVTTSFLVQVQTQSCWTCYDPTHLPTPTTGWKPSLVGLQPAQAPAASLEEEWAAYPAPLLELRDAGAAASHCTDGSARLWLRHGLHPCPRTRPLASTGTLSSKERSPFPQGRVLVYKDLRGSR